MDASDIEEAVGASLQKSTSRTQPTVAALQEFAEANPSEAEATAEGTARTARTSA